MDYVAFDVGVKLKTTDFHTWQRRLSEPIHLTGRLYSVGVELLDEFDHPRPFPLGRHGCPGITSEAALAFIDKLPAIESLMPALSVAHARVKLLGWL
jgi:hypothetical protein